MVRIRIACATGILIALAGCGNERPLVRETVFQERPGEESRASRSRAVIAATAPDAAPAVSVRSGAGTVIELEHLFDELADSIRRRDQMLTTELIAELRGRLDAERALIHSQITAESLERETRWRQ